MVSQQPSTISNFIEDLKHGPSFCDALVYHHHIASKPPDFGPDLPLEKPLSQTLAHLGIDRFYCHQVEAIEYLRKGSHVIVATPTASGKSLVYNLTVVEAILKDKHTRALYIFPLKALEQDQIKALRHFLGALGEADITAAIYDGDTSPYKRKKIRADPPQILFTTPDMLHQAILAFHENWDNLFKNLAFVVLDEVHTYRGIFGSHVNQVIRRLKRLCRHYGSHPRFVLLSATVSNPKQFAQGLVEEEAFA